MHQILSVVSLVCKTKTVDKDINLFSQLLNQSCIDKEGLVWFWSFLELIWWVLCGFVCLDRLGSPRISPTPPVVPPQKVLGPSWHPHQTPKKVLGGLGFKTELVQEDEDLAEMLSGK